MLYSAEHISSTEPALREHVAVDLFNKRFKKYREMYDGFNFKLLQNTPERNRGEDVRIGGLTNPETVRHRESKPTLQLSTIEIDCSGSQIGSKPALSRKSPKTMERMAPARSKVLSKVSVHGEEPAVGIFKKNKSKMLPALTYEG